MTDLIKQAVAAGLLACGTATLGGCLSGGGGGGGGGDNSESVSRPSQEAASPRGVVEEEFQGPGQLSFSWMPPRNQADSSRLSLIVNGATVATVTGQSDAETRTYNLPSGEVTVEWVHEGGAWRYDGGITGSDRESLADLDDVRFVEGAFQALPQRFPDNAVRWSDAFPDANASSEVVIDADQAVILDVPSVTVQSLMIHGQLLFDDRDTHLQSDWIHVHGPDALLQIGTEDRPISSNIRITLTDPRYVYREHVPLDKEVTGASDGQILWHVAEDGSEVPQWGFGNYKSLMVMGGGRLSVYSQSALKRSWTQLASPVLPGDTSLTLVQSTGWEAGDEIVLAPTGYIAEEAETFTVVSVGGRTVTVSQPAKHYHSAVVEEYEDINGRFRGLDMRAEVGLVSRNVVLEGDERSSDIRYGAHAMFMYPSTVNISGLQLQRCGQAGSQGRYCSHWHRPYVDNMLAITSKPDFLDVWERTPFGSKPETLPGTNAELWRLYMQGVDNQSLYEAASAEDRRTLDRLLIESIDATGDYIRNSSVRNSFQRAVNLHGVTGVTVDNNVAHDINNHAFVWAEDGNEFGNVMSNNLAVLVRNVLEPERMAFLKHGIVLPDDLTNVRSSCFERARGNGNPQAPSCQEENKTGAFWGENPFNVLRGNVAAGVTDRGNGFFSSGAFVTRTHWDAERGLYLMQSGDRMMPRDWKERGIVAPTPMVFENNRAHTISMVDGVPESGPSDANLYPPLITATGFFFRTFQRSSSAFGPGDFLMRGTQGYGFQDHGVWIEDHQILQDCILGASHKRLVVTKGVGDNLGVNNCVLVGDVGEPALERYENSNLRGFYFAFGPNFGRSPGSFRPFIRNSTVHNHAGGVLLEDAQSLERGSSTDMTNVSVFE